MTPDALCQVSVALNVPRHRAEDALRIAGWPLDGLGVVLVSESAWAGRLRADFQSGLARRRQLGLERAAARHLTTVPELFRDESDETLLGRSTVGLRELAARWTPSHGSLVISGPTKRGKSATAAILARSYVRERLKVSFTKAIDYQQYPLVHWLRVLDFCVHKQKSGYGPDPEADRRKEQLERASRCELLVIDELGEQQRVEWLQNLVEERYDRKRAILTTTGFSLLALTKHFGDAFIRRLIEAGNLGGVVVVS